MNRRYIREIDLEHGMYWFTPSRTDGVRMPEDELRVLRMVHGPVCIEPKWFFWPELRDNQTLLARQCR